MSLHACDLLAADADWEAPTWSMSLAAAEQLAKSLDVLLAGVGADVTVEALWEGRLRRRSNPSAELSLRVWSEGGCWVPIHATWSRKPDPAPR